MSSVDTPAQQPQSSITDMQAMASTRLPFRNKNMNYFFMDVLGSAVYGGAAPGECYSGAAGPGYRRCSWWAFHAVDGMRLMEMQPGSAVHPARQTRFCRRNLKTKPGLEASA